MSFICEDCGKELRSQGSLVYHKNRKNSCKNKYTCEFCSGVFNIKFHLKAHMINCIKKNINVVDQDHDGTDPDYVDYKKILNYTPDMIVKYDISGVIQYVSNSCKHILGYESSELLGKNGYDFVYEEDIILLQKEHTRMMLEKPESYVFILQRICKDKTIKKLYINTNVLLDDDGNVIGAITCEREFK